MILIKGFFRKLSTKVYLLIFSILLTVIITIMSFINYYTEILDQMYRENSFMVVITKTDYYNKLSSYKSIISIEEALLFEPNKNYKAIVNEDYVIIKDGVVVDSKENGGATRMNWEDFMIGEGTSGNFIVVFPSNRNGIELKDDEVALSLDPFTYHKKDIAQGIVGEKIGFYYKSKNYEYTINGFYPTEIPGMLVSNRVFQTMNENKDLYAYLVKFNSKKSSTSVAQKLKQSDKNIEVLNRQRYYAENDGMSSARLIDLIDILGFVSNTIILIFVTIFIVAIKNIIKDSKENMALEKMLGYNHHQIKYCLFSKLIILSGISLIVSTLLSVIINIIINYYYQTELMIFNIMLLSTLYIIVVIISIFTCFITKIKKYEI